jgi:2-isopropylmalate synthase
MLKHQATYEIMRPESVGVTQTSLVLGKHSGRAALSSRLADLGYSFDNAALDRIFIRFKALADRRKAVADADIEALVHDDAKPQDELVTLEGLQVACGTQGMATATVRVRGLDGRTQVHAAVGTGPVDAAFKAIDEVVNMPSELLEFSVRAVTEGIDALGEVTVRVQSLTTEHDTKNAQHQGSAPVFHGAAADTDIIVASAKAYLKALNRMLVAFDARSAAEGHARSETKTQAAPRAANEGRS